MMPEKDGFLGSRAIQRENDVAAPDIIMLTSAISAAMLPVPGIRHRRLPSQTSETVGPFQTSGPSLGSHDRFGESHFWQFRTRC